MKKLLLLLPLCFTTMQAAHYEALCITPVANLFHPALHEKYPNASEEEIEHLYDHFPLGTVKNADCLRIHQLLLNEVVTVLQEKGNEVYVEIHNAFYHNSLWDGKKSSFWTLKKYLIPIDQITNQEFIPAPLNYKNPSSFNPQEKTIFSLTEPFYDEELTQTYSVRTRFKLLEHTKNKVTVARFNPKTLSFEPLTLPQDYGIINTNLAPAKKIAGMLNLLQIWADPENPLPCARGGCSAKERVNPYNYHTVSFELPDTTTIEVYERPECEPVFAGFDGIGLIMSACQIYHIPFCAKNTKTTGRYLPLFNTDFDTLEAGDIILAKGYAGIIVDPKQHLLIEARGNTFHNGTVRITHFSKTFKNIHNSTDLLEKYNKRKPITLLDNQSKGMISAPFVIVKLNTLFDEITWKKPLNFLF